MILEMFFMLRRYLKNLKKYIQILYLDCMIHQREVILKKVIESSKIKSYVDFVKENQAPGLQSSLIPFTSFCSTRNYTRKLFNRCAEDRQDDYRNVFNQKVKSLAKRSDVIKCKCGWSWI
jgi:hypothetical protein